MPTESKTSARKLTSLEREQKSLELRMAGASYEQIGNTLGITKQGAYAAVVRALDKLKEKAMEDAEQLRTLELQRMDALFLKMYAQASKGDQGAVDRCIRIMDRRAKLIGLDAPVRKELTGKDGEPLINESEHNRAISTLANAIRESISGEGAE